MRPGWRTVRLAHAARIVVSNIDKHTVDGQPSVRLCNYVDVYKNDKITDDLTFMQASASPDQVRAFALERDDVIITKDSESPDDIAVPALVDYASPDLVCGYHLAIVRARRGEAHGPFLAWVMRSAPAFAYWPTVARGMTRYGIRAQDIAGFALSLPPLPEQRAIAAYLDRETAEIDALVAAQETLIGTLRERRAAVVESAFNGGETFRLQHLLTARPNYGVLVPTYTVESNGVPFVRVSDLTSGEFSALRKIAAEQSEEYRRTALVGGEILLGVVGKMGTRRLAPRGLAGANVARAVAVLRPRSGTIGRLLLHWLGTRGFLDQALLATGADTAQPTLGMADLWGFRLSLPPVHQQRYIADYLDEKTAEIDALIAETERFIALSKERRAALITAAVTGQIDCTHLISEGA